MVSQVPNSTRNTYPSQLGKWSVCNDPHGSFVDEGDVKVMLSAPTSISIIRGDIIIGAKAIG
jgi:hypothetical protein